MRFSREITALSQDPRYADAKSIFDSIKSGSVPSLETLNRLFADKITKIAQKDIECFLIDNIPSHRKIRGHIHKAPTDISDARSKAELMPPFQKIHSSLLNKQIPDTKLVNEFYGEFTPFVLSVFQNFINYNMTRKCGLSSTAHLNRVGTIATVLNINDENSKLYSAIAVGHDLIEDLLYKVKDENNKNYGFDRYEEFIDKFIPHQLREGISILTNHYDLIIKYVVEYLEEENKALTSDNIVKAIISLQVKNNPVISKYAEKTLSVIQKLPEGTKNLDEIRWYCYKDLYIKDIAEHSMTADNFRFYELKSFDLSDNGHGIGSLSMDARIKNLLKQEAWAREGYLFKTKFDPINRRIMELNEDILVFAEFFVLRDLLEYQSIQDFLISAMYKIKRLEKILFTD
jgi:hypothetical protein